ncbi:hypothetical protein WN943_027137 [Citrus x changshan-huyou]
MGDASLVVVSSLNDSRDTLSDSDDNYYEYDYSSAVFVWFLESENPSKLQFQEAWALTSIVVKRTKKARVILENDEVLKRLKLLCYTNDKVQEHVVWALRSLAVNSYDYYLLVLNHGFLIYLLELLNEYKYLSNLIAKKQQMKMEMLIVGVMTYKTTKGELASCSKWRMEVEEDINLLLCVFVMNMKMIELHCLYIVKPYVLYIVNLGYSVMRRISSGDSSALF